MLNFSRASQVGARGVGCKILKYGLRVWMSIRRDSKNEARIQNSNLKAINSKLAVQARWDNSDFWTYELTFSWGLKSWSGKFRLDKFICALKLWLSAPRPTAFNLSSKPQSPSCITWADQIQQLNLNLEIPDPRLNPDPRTRTQDCYLGLNLETPSRNDYLKKRQDS